MLRREVIGQPECPLMYRWTLVNVRVAKLLLHHFLPTQRDRDPHDHPRSFVTFVFRGGYRDISPCPRCDDSSGWIHYFEVLLRCPVCDGGEVIDHVRAPAIRYRPATHAHVTVTDGDGAWSLVAMGPLVRAWGFLRDGGWWPWPEYEARYGGSFRCE